MQYNFYFPRYVFLWSDLLQFFLYSDEETHRTFCGMFLDLYFASGRVLSLQYITAIFLFWWRALTHRTFWGICSAIYFASKKAVGITAPSLTTLVCVRASNHNIDWYPWSWQTGRVSSLQYTTHAVGGGGLVFWVRHRYMSAGDDFKACIQEWSQSDREDLGWWFGMCRRSGGMEAFYSLL